MTAKSISLLNVSKNGDTPQKRDPKNIKNFNKQRMMNG